MPRENGGGIFVKVIEGRGNVGLFTNVEQRQKSGLKKFREVKKKRDTNEQIAF